MEYSRIPLTVGLYIYYVNSSSDSVLAFYKCINVTLNVKCQFKFTLTLIYYVLKIVNFYSKCFYSVDILYYFYYYYSIFNGILNPRTLRF